MTRRILLLAALLLGLVAAPATALPPGSFPDLIPLPNGFAPEGIAIRGATAFAGSLADGDVVAVDLRRGTVHTIVEGPGTPAVGLAVDRFGRLWVAGGPEGTGRVYDLDSGDLIADLALGEGFINDVVITPWAAWFTNSNAAELYRVPIGWHGAIGTVEVVPLTGDWQQVPDAFNANGIEATPGGHSLIVVQSNAPEQDGTSALYKVNPWTGHARRITLDQDIMNGDGLVLVGRRQLYVVQNRQNSIAKIHLSPWLLDGTVVDTITSPNFDVPTTAARFGPRLYAVNARFGTPPGPDVEYHMVAVRR